ncbi:DNA cytosine methyltransferase [Virgibacillus sp. MG-45]|uniref:DNA cytosine methyltransferase n=1 Tax=Virgibacillus sp. MG-45 TaxID=3102791 RepID=UPI002ED9CACE
MQIQIKSQKNQLNIPQVVDLFSGCGGLSFGFHLEGFKICSGVEMDPQACNTASYNLHWKNGEDKEHLNNDVSKVTPEELGINPGKSVITIGGPPCQAYSRIGRSKLKSLGEHRFGLNDKRAFLYKEFVRMAVNADSEAIVMENVPESVNFLGMNIPQIVCDILEENGYNAVWTILNAADFGVPQTRERAFVIAHKKRYGEIRYMPEPTHKNSPSIVRNPNIFHKYNGMRNFRAPKLPSDDTLEEWVTVGEALSDLPALFLDASSPYKVVKVNTKMAYQAPPLNNFQREMRKGKGSNIRNNVDGNCFRRTLRDFRIFEKMQPGDDYRHAHEIAISLFEEACEFHKISVNDKESYERLKKDYVPPYDTTKFHSKWKRLDPKKPSHTLVAHLGTDTYSHIHPWEPRGITVREAARLQSFPDDFIFNVPMGTAFKQIGNAVPPMLARAVAKSVLKNISLE